MAGCCFAGGAAGGLCPWLFVACELEPHWHISEFPGVSSDRTQPFFCVCLYVEETPLSNESPGSTAAFNFSKNSIQGTSAWLPLSFTQNIFFSCLTFILMYMQHPYISLAVLHHRLTSFLPFS